MAQFADMRISEKSSDPVKITHGERDELQQQQMPWPRPSAPATIHTTATQVSDDQHHGEDEGDHPHKKSVLQKVKDKAKKLIKKKKPGHGHGDDHREEEDHHHFEEEEEGEEEDDDTEWEEEGKTSDLNPPDFHSRPLGDASAVSPGLDTFSARSLLKDSELARDPEAPKSRVQWTSLDPSVVATGHEARASSPAETARRQQEVPAAPGYSSAGIAPILQSREATYSSTTRDPDYDVQRSDASPDNHMARRVHDIGTTHTAAPDSTLHVPAIKTQLPQQLPNYNRRKEVPENVVHWQDEPERIEYSDPFAKSPTLPEEIMKPDVTEEPAMEKLVQRAGEVCGFDTNKGDIASDVGAGAPSVKDQKASATHGDWEESGPTESISDELKSSENKLGGKEINRHSTVSDEPQDVKVQDASSVECNENAGRSATFETVTSVVGTAVGAAQGLKDRIAMGLGSTGPHGDENNKEREDEEGVKHDKSYTEKIYGMTSTAKNAIASKLGYVEHHEPVDGAPNEPNRSAPEENNYESSEEGKSYKDKIYNTASATKNVISSKLGYDEHKVPVQEEAEKKTDQPLADHDEGAHDEGGKSFTDKIYDTASAANSVVSSKLGYGGQEDHDVEKKPERQTMEKYEDDKRTKSDEHEHDKGEGKSYTEKIYETAATAKNAISSKFGPRGKETGQDHGQQIDEVSKSESDAHPLVYTN